MLFLPRLKLRGTCLKRQVCMHHACMTAGSIAILRSRRRHASETVESVARDRGPSADSHAVPARAAPLRAAPAETRCRAVRSYGPRPHGPCGRHRGRHRHVVYEPATAYGSRWLTTTRGEARNHQSCRGSHDICDVSVARFITNPLQPKK